MSEEECTGMVGRMRRAQEIKDAGEVVPHCFHSTGVAILTIPPIYEERCCWCDTRRTTSGSGGPAGSHGEYLPRMTRT